MENGLLKQQIEFLQMQLDDMKIRETQQKNMYETMIKSLDGSAYLETEKEMKIIKENHCNEVKALEIVYLGQIQGYQQKIEDLDKKLKVLNENNRLVIDRFNENIEKLENSNKLIEDERNTMKKQLEYAIDKIEYLKEVEKRIEYERNLNNDHVLMIKKQFRNDLEDLLKGQEREKTELTRIIEAQYEKIAKNCSIADSINEILSSKALESLKIQVFKSCDSLSSHLSSPSLSNQEIIFALSSFHQLYKALESSIEQANKPSQCFSLSQTPSVSFSTNILTENPKLTQFRSENTENNPQPSQKWLHNRSQSLFPVENSLYLETHKENTHTEGNFQQKEAEKMIKFASSMECEFCKYLFPTSKFYDHLLCCINEMESINFGSQDRPSSEKLERMEKQINDLKLALGKLKNQRDKARIYADKLLLCLKKTKLEHAVAEEDAGQRQLELKNEIKCIYAFVFRLRGVVSIPACLSTEIDQMVHKSSRFFGGKILFRYW